MTVLSEQNPNEFAYTFVRNVPAENNQGQKSMICLAIVQWPGTGHTERLAINEDMIAYRSNGNPANDEEVIAQEVRAFVTNRT